MKIKNINTKKKVLIIAEIGNNHEGSLKNAKKLILLAKKSGADAVKFQTYKTENLVSKKNKKRFNQLKKFELKKKDFIKLKNLAKKQKLLFISTPFDLESARFLIKICDAIKIASSDNNYFELINEVCLSNKPIIISTGLLNSNQVFKLYNKLIKIHGKKIINKLALLHCITSYPANDVDLNLRSIKELKKKIKCTVGYSDHSIGPLAAILSTISGAEIIEKHFTISKDFSNFRDHKLSSDPTEMSFITNSIKRISHMLGKKRKIINRSEKRNIKLVRRSIFSNIDIFKNTKINKKNIKVVRPGYGIPPNELSKVLGKLARKKIKKDSLIKLSQIKNK